jgi:hypothetical protein
MNNTLKENILFRSGDEPYDENAYKEAISVCALEQNLSIRDGSCKKQINILSYLQQVPNNNNATHISIDNRSCGRNRIIIIPDTCYFNELL